MIQPIPAATQFWSDQLKSAHRCHDIWHDDTHVNVTQHSRINYAARLNIFCSFLQQSQVSFTKCHYAKCRGTFMYSWPLCTEQSRNLKRKLFKRKVCERNLTVFKHFYGLWRHYTQHKDIQHNNVWLNETQLNDVQHNDTQYYASSC